MGGLLLIGCVFAGCSARSTSSPSIPATLSTPPSQWTLAVRADGPRWLGADWWRAQGLDPATLSHENVRLQQAGRDIPTRWIDAPDGPGLLFYGQPTTDLGDLGLAGAYTLTLGAPGTSMASAPSLPLHAPFQVTTTAVLRRAPNLVYRAAAPMTRPWFWRSLFAPDALTLTLPLTDAVPGPVALSLRVWGQSRAPQAPDHHLRVLWDGVEVSDHFWDGSEMEAWTVEGADLTTDGSESHTLVLDAPGDTGAPVDVTWIDAITVTWTRNLRFDGDNADWARWRATAASAACWEHLSDDAHLLMVPSKSEGEVWHAKVGDIATTEAGRRCLPQELFGQGWIGRPDAAPAPDLIRPRETLSMPALLATAYLIIAPREFHAPLAPLQAAREAEGLTATLVTPAQVYATFSEGLPTAQGIQKAVGVLHDRGQLRYLLLVGDAVADPLALWQQDRSQVPTGWVRTAVMGRTPSDHALVQGLDGEREGEPLVAVGRFPATTATEVAAMVERTLAWAPPPRPLLLVDNEPSFAALADDLADVAPADARISASEADARAKLLRWLRAESDRSVIIIYSGHGSLPMLGDEKLLTREDAGAWRSPTVVVAWTCLCANITHPTHAGLGEVWLRAPEGVAALVGPTGETTTAEQRPMALAFRRAWIDGARLGDALLQGWRATPSRDAETSFILLGDPALPMQGHQDE